MWDQHPMMKDWECMTDILLESPDQQDDRKNEISGSLDLKRNLCFST